VSVARLAALIAERKPCVVLTGAGISTESGVPDFRSRTGIWAQYDPMEVGTIDAFRRQPARVWEFYALRLGILGDVRPNAGHEAIADLERRGFVGAVITQNVDGLHQRAGSRDVVEMHGSLDHVLCVGCGRRDSIESVREDLRASGVPCCRVCGEVLKPGVVMFGELLPTGAIDRATRLAQDAGLMLVVGSTLEVWPVAGLPLEAAAYAIVNRGPTALDAGAALTIDAGAGETLTALAEALPARGDENPPGVGCQE
jgi:NAD-dependent deacetylase